MVLNLDSVRLPIPFFSLISPSLYAMDSFRRSCKSHAVSHKYSSSRSLINDLEKQPILLENDVAEHGSELEVKIDGNSHHPGAAAERIGGGNVPNKVRRESSYEFWRPEGTDRGRNEGGGSGLRDEDGGDGFSFMSPKTKFPGEEIAEDPPSRLIHTFLAQQRANGEEMALDMDMEMEELRRNSYSPGHVFGGSMDHRVSFRDSSRDEPYPDQQPPSSESDDNDTDDPDSGLRHRKALTAKPDQVGAGEEVLRCTSTSSLRRNSTMLCSKTRSRILDPAPPPSSPPPQTAATGNEEVRRSGWIPKSGQVKSGFIGKSQRMDEEDDDPFMDEHIPDELKRSGFSWLTLLEWVSLVLILAAFACSLSLPSLRRMTALELHLWKWLLLLFVLICGRLVSGWVVRWIVFWIERNFLLLRKRVLYFVYGVRRAVQNCLWLGLVLLSWQFLFDKNVQARVKSGNLHYVTKVLFCLLVANLFRLAKTLFVKVLASSFHVSTYFDRIQESLFNQYVIGILSGPPLMEIQTIKEEEERTAAEVQMLQNAGARIPTELQAAALSCKTGRVAGNDSVGKSTQIGKSTKLTSPKHLDEGITIDELHKLNQKNVSAWRMKRLVRIVRYGTLATLDEQVRQGAGEDDPVTQICSEFEAKAAARKIFNNVARPGAKHIYLTDLLRFMKNEEAIKTMNLFEGAQEKSRVSRRSLKNWVVNAFRERRALALTLNDTKTAVNKLHQMANVIVSIIVFAIWLLILGIATTHFFVLLSSQLLLLVFIFGNTLKMVFESIIFLFAMHPFDVGDRCEIDGVQMFVEEMNILTTVFLRFDNLKVTYPNTVLATLPLGNFYRSPDMGESIDFCIHVATPVEKIAIMRERILGYLENKKEHWYPGPLVVLRDVDDMNKLKISIWMRHRINFQDMGERFVRRELVVQEMIKVLRELDIEYRMAPLDVNVRNMHVVNSTRLPSTWTTFTL
ncbi:mechanosensitive ion channel protein 6-like [Zingiber officinale]|uniref:mechanosensitive ion channel protein 6-like n=1 Tax=Zingiber officinale TaxID=94328 RepID=UPI001C4C7B46|nr:mechanosensitive ion channel protein 6-like [Zingiber officinale]